MADDPFAQYAVKADPFAAYAVKPEAPAKQPESMGRQIGRMAIDTLPGIGGLVGGILSTPETLGAGTVPGAALGVGAGVGLRDLIGHYTGLDAPTTPTEKAGHIAKEAGIAAATGYVLPGLATAAKSPIQTFREGAEQFGSAMPPAIRRLGNLLPSLPKPAQGRLLTRPAWQTWETAAPEVASSEVAPPTAAEAPASGLSAVDRAALVKQGYPAEVIAKIEQAVGQPTVSHAPVAAAPAEAVSAAPPVQPELQGPRIQTGAEKVGRLVGMTKDDVRQAAGPVLDETRGEASPILPKDALGRIIDTIKAMPPGSPEREAYVTRATSGKTKWQVENIRRTLEHLGLIVPVAAAGPSIRDELLRLMSSHQPEGS